MIRDTVLVAVAIGVVWTLVIDGLASLEILGILASVAAGAVSGSWLCGVSKAREDVSVHAVVGMFFMGISMIVVSEALYILGGYERAGGVDVIEIVTPSGMVVPQTVAMIVIAILASLGVLVGVTGYEGKDYRGMVGFGQGLLAMVGLALIGLAIHGVFGA